MPLSSSANEEPVFSMGKGYTCMEACRDCHQLQRRRFCVITSLQRIMQARALYIASFRKGPVRTSDCGSSFITGTGVYHDRGLIIIYFVGFSVNPPLQGGILSNSHH